MTQYKAAPGFVSPGESVKALFTIHAMCTTRCSVANFAAAAYDGMVDWSHEMFIWSAGNQLKRIPKGRKQEFECLRCHQVATFYECESDDTVKAFFVVELWKKSKRVMQCGEYLGVCDYYSLFPEEKKADEEAAMKAAAERKDREEKAAAEEKAKAEKEQARQEEVDRKRREAERARKDKDLDDELEKLKKKMGQ